MEKILLTTSAVEKLERKLDRLVLVDRKRLANEIKTARGYGDLSENAEYHAAREMQAHNEGEIAELKELLNNYELVEESNDSTKIHINSKVSIQYMDTNEISEIIIVPSVEAEPFEGKISNLSPIGKTLLGHTRNEIIPVEIPKGILNIKILEIN
ncbi:transcription elongation factor GreA [Clostridiaceae bacterium HSG29]|nr:transcription elongation factor GreA [Clostridiaceae bacterium HSG29]